MNILVPYSWLKEHLETKASPKQLAEYLSLCSQSVEKISKKGEKEWVYEIEVTTNRPDCLAVYGVARELAAILPRFGIRARLRPIPEEKIEIPAVKKGLPLEVKIEKSSLCPRFTALIFEGVKIAPSPETVQQRLIYSGIRALNNVVDISNYLMLELGQPMHTFDYDKIKGAKMILRQAQKGEEVTTLDGITRQLPAGAIVIEDGAGRLIDLCGIMGGENSQVDEETKRVLLFVQTYDPVKIRQTCQALGFRTEAASRFEKGVNPEGVILAMKKAIALFEDNCGAKVASSLIDIYPSPLQPKKVTLELSEVDRLVGVKIKRRQVIEILKSLGFSLLSEGETKLTFSVPFWRHDDISLPEDLIEEVARIYGYHRLPAVLPKGNLPKAFEEPQFFWEERVKDMLKYWGFVETVNYSLVGKKELQRLGFEPQQALRVSNPLSRNLTYLRPSLIPSLLGVVAKNQAREEEIKLFELANVYLPRKSNQLPEEKMMLGVVMTGENFYRLKGVLESMLAELGVDFELEPETKGVFWHPQRTGKILTGKGKVLGLLGEIRPKILAAWGIEKRVVVLELDFPQLVAVARPDKMYSPVSPYQPVREDLAFVVPPKTLVGQILREIRKVDPLIQEVRLLDSFGNTRTFRISYQDPQKNLSSSEVEKVRNAVVRLMKKKFAASLKGKGV